MKVHVLLSPHNVDELYFTKKTTVVIDVLRANSVITTSISNGAKEIVPVDTVEFAVKVSGNAFGGKTLLGGERNTIMIEGFNLGNSPQDYTNEIVEGKSIILYTTNGSKAIVKSKFSENLLICSFHNLAAIANYLLKLSKDVEILCAGSNGMFCLEDTVCAGMLVNKIKEISSDVEFTDAAKSSSILSDHFGSDIEKLLYNCEHGKLLIKNGFEQDIQECCKVDIYDTIPIYSSGVIKAGFEAENNSNP